MYRLPSQFDPSGRQDDLSAAGGGSTSTCCCSCVVTLAAASTFTARHFVSLVPAEPETESSATQDNLPQAVEETPGFIDPSPPMSTWARGTLGAFVLILAVLAAVGGSMAVPMFGVFVGVAVYIGIFCMVYSRSNRSVPRGILVAVVSLIAIVACAAAELFVWATLVLK